MKVEILFSKKELLEPEKEKLLKIFYKAYQRKQQQRRGSHGGNSKSTTLGKSPSLHKNLEVCNYQESK